MSSSTKLIKPPREEYDDEVLYGQRMEAARSEALLKVDKDSECVMYGIGTAYPDHKLNWNIKNLIGSSDGRQKRMMDGLNIAHTLPLQRYAWPQIELAKHPILLVSPEGTGKTMTHLLYAVSRCIKATPMAKTTEILSTSDALGSFKTTNGHVSNGQLSANLDDIDQENFDFDSLGAIPEKKTFNGDKQTKDSGSNANGIDEKKVESTKSDSEGWGFTTEEHFEVNADEFIFHPKYIIVSSNQHQVEFMEREINRMKLCAFGDDRFTSMKLRELPPKVRTLNVHQDDAKLALRCNEAEILIATPKPLTKCFENEYLKFAKCKKIFFDDLDLTLQLHNYNVKELIKRYKVETQFADNAGTNDQDDNTNANCQIYFFSRKWTDLVKQFLHTVFSQIVIMFGSIAEAALYANMRYDLEVCANQNAKLSKLSNLIKLQPNKDGENKKIAIVCRSDSEAEKVSQALANCDYFVKFLPKDTPIIALRSRCVTNGYKNPVKTIYVMGDAALDLVSQELTDVTCIIHYTMPKTMLEFDQRFRLMYTHIKEVRKEPICTTIFVNYELNSKHAKELYDMMSRSSSTLKSTKLELRDLISDTSNTICWRWASTGLCRLEKLSREDRFGTYCPDKHSVTASKLRQSTRWPTGGQIKITITHLVSPNEFYFWFEAHRDKNSKGKKWNKLESTGSEFMKAMQVKLDKFKDLQSYSVPVARLRKGRIYGIYLQQEARVDRVRLIEDPAIDKEMANQTLSGYHFLKQCEVFKIDYGVRMHVYLKNLFELPAQLAEIEAQCHRGFHLGVKPTDNEPDWLFKAKQRFYDLVCLPNLHEITVWLRLNSDNCFWFDRMTIICRLGNIDDRQFYKSEPHAELVKAQLAARSTNEPSCLNPSEILLTLSKWHVERSEEYVQYAFLRRDKPVPLQHIFVLNIWNNLDLTVRQHDFNKQLIELERRMLEDYYKRKLDPLNYFKVGIYCLARIPDPEAESQDKEPIYTINRVKILSIMGDKSGDEITEIKDCRFSVDCLDHGDRYEVEKSQLYHAAPDHLSQLPFQAIKAELANLDPTILERPELVELIRGHMYGYTRTATNQLAKVACRIKQDGKLQLFIPSPNNNLETVESLFKRVHKIQLIE